LQKGPDASIRSRKSATKNKLNSLNTSNFKLIFPPPDLDLFDGVPSQNEISMQNISDEEKLLTLFSIKTKLINQKTL
jgi:hypothetical protein